MSTSSWVSLPLRFHIKSKEYYLITWKAYNGLSDDYDTVVPGDRILYDGSIGPFNNGPRKRLKGNGKTMIIWFDWHNALYAVLNLQGLEDEW